MPFKSVSTFEIDESMSTLLSSIAKNSFDLPNLTLEYHRKLQVSRYIILLCYSDCWVGYQMCHFLYSITYQKL